MSEDNTEQIVNDLSKEDVNGNLFTEEDVKSVFILQPKTTILNSISKSLKKFKTGKQKRQIDNEIPDLDKIIKPIHDKLKKDELPKYYCSKDDYTTIYAISDIHSDYKTLFRHLIKFKFITYSNENIITDINDNNFDIYNPLLVSNVKWNPEKNKTLLVICGDIVDGCRPKFENREKIGGTDVIDPKGMYELLLHMFLRNLKISARNNESDVILLCGNHDNIYDINLYKNYVHENAQKFYKSYQNRNNILAPFYNNNFTLFFGILKEKKPFHDELLKIRNMIETDLEKKKISRDDLSNIDKLKEKTKLDFDFIDKIQHNLGMFKQELKEKAYKPDSIHKLEYLIGKDNNYRIGIINIIDNEITKNEKHYPYSIYHFDILFMHGGIHFSVNNTKKMKNNYQYMVSPKEGFEIFDNTLIDQQEILKNNENHEKEEYRSILNLINTKYYKAFDNNDEGTNILWARGDSYIDATNGKKDEEYSYNATKYKKIERKICTRYKDLPTLIVGHCINEDQMYAQPNNESRICTSNPLHIEYLNDKGPMDKDGNYSMINTTRHPSCVYPKCFVKKGDKYIPKVINIDTGLSGCFHKNSKSPIDYFEILKISTQNDEYGTISIKDGKEMSYNLENVQTQNDIDTMETYFKEDDTKLKDFEDDRRNKIQDDRTKALINAYNEEYPETNGGKKRSTKKRKPRKTRRKSNKRSRRIRRHSRR
jgi:hypothetical protein